LITTSFTGDKQRNQSTSILHNLTNNCVFVPGGFMDVFIIFTAV